MDLNPVRYLRFKQARRLRVRDEVDFFRRRHPDDPHGAVVAKLKRGDLSSHYRSLLVEAERILRPRPAWQKALMRALPGATESRSEPGPETDIKA